MIIHNCHTHTFTLQNVPDKFLSFLPIRFLARYDLTKWLALYLNSLVPFSNRDIFDRYATFLRQGDQSTQADTLQTMKKYYPPGTKFVVHSMDMDFMKAGNAKCDFQVQIEELAEIKQKDKDQLLYPFIGIDPHRKDLTGMVRHYIEKKGFAGIKMYPPLGFWPFDERLYPVYEYAEKYQVPITTHCGVGGIFYKGKKEKEWLVHPKTGVKLKKTRNKKFMNNFADPDNYYHILKDFPNLKICFAHFGGGHQWKIYLRTPYESVYMNSWFYKVKELLKNPAYPNLYTDISYTISDFKLLDLLKITLMDSVLADKILFGSDFYMVNLEGSEFIFSIKLSQEIGENNFRKIAETNPTRFLEKKEA